jgi:hypothetical protein
MLDLCRDAFNHGWTITIDFDVQPGRQNGLLIRATLTRPPEGTIAEVGNVVDARSDPAAVGRLDPAVLTGAPPPPPEEVGKGAHALMEETRWSPVEAFVLASGGSRDVPVRVEGTALVLARATWSGTPVPPSLRLMRGGSVLATGVATPLPPDRGGVLGDVEVKGAGDVVVRIENSGGASATVQLAVGVLPVAQ